MMDAQFERLSNQVSRLANDLNEILPNVTGLRRVVDGEPGVGPGLKARMDKIEADVAANRNAIDQFMLEWKAYKVERRHQEEMAQARHKALLVGMGLNVAGIGTGTVAIIRALQGFL